jgi:hypothetical protein
MTDEFECYTRLGSILAAGTGAAVPTHYKRGQCSEMLAEGSLRSVEPSP